jgi:hypothetical protein
MWLIWRAQQPFPGEHPGKPASVQIRGVRYMLLIFWYTGMVSPTLELLNAVNQEPDPFPAHWKPPKWTHTTRQKSQSSCSPRAPGNYGHTYTLFLFSFFEWFATTQRNVGCNKQVAVQTCLFRGSMSRNMHDKNCLFLREMQVLSNGK